MPEPLTIPNPDIPPRTSSAGALTTNGTGSYTYSGAGAQLLKPLPEDQWLGSSSSASPAAQQYAGGIGIPSRSKSLGHRRTATVPTSLDKGGLEASKSAAAAAGEAAIGGTWSVEKEQIVLGPYDYIVQQPGKDIRKQLIAAFNRWLQVPRESLEIITRVVLMLHTASLLVDDVEDNSDLRRGVPVAHNIFGTAQTINSANYVYFQALEEIQKLKQPAAIRVYTEELLNLHRGQGMDLYWRDTLTCPTEEDYLEMVGNKTGGLFRLAIRLMQAESESTVDCTPLVNLMGLIFQICDDYLNLSSSNYSKNKGLCEDLTEGKFSFPIIHSIRSQPGNLQLINILKLKTRDDQVKRYAVKLMDSAGSFEYTRRVVAQLRDKALAQIDALEDALDAGSGEKSGESVRSILNRIVEPTLQAANGQPAS